MKLIIAGNSNRDLASKVSSLNNWQFIASDSRKFADGELQIDIQGKLADKEVFIFQSTSTPVNDNLMELLLIADAAKRVGVRKVTGILPYFGYGRQDKKFINNNTPISASLVASLLEVAGFDHIVTIDLHSPQCEGFFRIPITHLAALDVFLPIIREYENPLIMSPDVGGIARARKISQILGVDFGFINKYRNKANHCDAREVIGNVRNKNCILIDDMVDTGNTLSIAAKLLNQQGALTVNVFVTHAILSGESISLLDKAQIDKIYITDTIKAENVTDKFKIISVDSLLAAKIKHC